MQNWFRLRRFSDIRIKNIPTKEKLKMVIIKRENYFELHATSKSSAIELKANLFLSAVQLYTLTTRIQLVVNTKIGMPNLAEKNAFR